MGAVDVLMKARAYVKKGWCQWAPSCDVQGNWLRTATDPAAVSWCLTGAIERALADVGDPNPRNLLASDPIRDQLRHLFQETTGVVGPEWNNRSSRTKEEVFDAFDQAIELGLKETGER